jgi:hypothetical protein
MAALQQDYMKTTDFTFVDGLLTKAPQKARVTRFSSTWPASAHLTQQTAIR